MSSRIDKVNSLLEYEISKIILRDFTFADAIATLTRVDTTANLIEARAYISVFPSTSAKSSGETKDEKTDKIIKILNNNVYDIQQKINKKLNMRPIPKIIFVKDENVREAARVEALLDKIKRLD
ncbi:MAG: ribosome-binding factor A [Patescibacteria group bacterium]